MPISRSVVAEHQRSLVWGAWVELGVSGWQRTHSNWAIDPEPLIIATAGLGDFDPRLRDEALDWCIHQWRYVSRVRLRNLLRKQPPSICDAWGPFAATVSHHSGVQWPSATRAISYQTTGRSSLDSMDQPSRAWVRMRGMFGVGARTEILRYFLSRKRRATSSTIAEQIGYAKRNVADECERLVRAGVLRTQPVANRFYYALARAEELSGFVGDIAPIRPDWTAVFAITHAFVALEEKAQAMSDRALMVEAHRVAESIDEHLDVLNIDERPELNDPSSFWPAVRAFAERQTAAWAVGQWAALDDVVPIRRRPPRRLASPR